MTDDARVIGASSDEANAARFAALPRGLKPVMDAMYDAEHVVIGAASLGPWRQAQNTHVYALSRDPSFDPGAEHIEVVSDHRTLVERFEHGDEKLLVAGGRSVFRLFLPYASRLDVAITDELVPGDLVFADWDGLFRLEAEEDWAGGRTCTYVPRSVKARNAVGLYLEGIRDGNTREAVKRYTGARYTQHSTGVGDGAEGFVAFFGDFLERNPQRDIRVVRAIEDDRYVFVHVAQKLGGGEAEWVTMDLFDTDAEEKLVEHWDVIAALESPRQIDGPRDATRFAATETNKALVRRFLVEVYQNGLVDRIADFVAPDLVQHELGVADGREAYATHVGRCQAAGQRYDHVFKVIGEGSLVVSYAKVDMPSESHAVFEIWRVEDGRIAERWINAEPIPPREQWANSGKF